jgi:predicted DNA repair protein MutK
MGAAVGVLPGLIGWIVTALGGAVVGLVIGGIIVLIVRRFTKHPEELIVD